MYHCNRCRIALNDGQACSCLCNKIFCYTCSAIHGFIAELNKNPVCTINSNSNRNKALEQNKKSFNC